MSLRVFIGSCVIALQAAHSAFSGPEPADVGQRQAASSALMLKRQAPGKECQGQRGPQRSPTKLPVTVRFSPEVVAYFKATGGCLANANE